MPEKEFLNHVGSLLSEIDDTYRMWGGFQASLGHAGRRGWKFWSTSTPADLCYTAFKFAMVDLDKARCAVGYLLNEYRKERESPE